MLSKFKCILRFRTPFLLKSGVRASCSEICSLQSNYNVTEHQQYAARSNEETVGTSTTFQDCQGLHESYDFNADFAKTSAEQSLVNLEPYLTARKSTAGIHCKVRSLPSQRVSPIHTASLLSCGGRTSNICNSAGVRYIHRDKRGSIFGKLVGYVTRRKEDDGINKAMQKETIKESVPLATQLLQCETADQVLQILDPQIQNQNPKKKKTKTTKKQNHLSQEESIDVLHRIVDLKYKEIREQIFPFSKHTDDAREVYTNLIFEGCLEEVFSGLHNSETFQILLTSIDKYVDKLTPTQLVNVLDYVGLLAVPNGNILKTNLFLRIPDLDAAEFDICSISALYLSLSKIYVQHVCAEMYTRQMTAVLIKSGKRVESDKLSFSALITLGRLELSCGIAPAMERLSWYFKEIYRLVTESDLMSDYTSAGHSLAFCSQFVASVKKLHKEDPHTFERMINDKSEWSEMIDKIIDVTTTKIAENSYVITPKEIFSVSYPAILLNMYDSNVPWAEHIKKKAFSYLTSDDLNSSEFVYVLQGTSLTFHGRIDDVIHIAAEKHIPRLCAGELYTLIKSLLKTQRISDTHLILLSQKAIIDKWYKLLQNKSYFRDIACYLKWSSSFACVGDKDLERLQHKLVKYWDHSFNVLPDIGDIKMLSFLMLCPTLMSSTIGLVSQWHFGYLFSKVEHLQVMLNLLREIGYSQRRYRHASYKWEPSSLRENVKFHFLLERELLKRIIFTDKLRNTYVNDSSVCYRFVQRKTHDPQFTELMLEKAESDLHMMADTGIISAEKLVTILILIAQYNFRDKTITTVVLKVLSDCIKQDNRLEVDVRMVELFFDWCGKADIRLAKNPGIWILMEVIEDRLFPNITLNNCLELLDMMHLCDIRPTERMMQSLHDRCRKEFLSRGYGRNGERSKQVTHSLLSKLRRYTDLDKQDYVPPEWKFPNAKLDVLKAVMGDDDLPELIEEILGGPQYFQSQVDLEYDLYADYEFLLDKNRRPVAYSMNNAKNSDTQRVLIKCFPLRKPTTDSKKYTAHLQQLGYNVIDIYVKSFMNDIELCEPQEKIDYLKSRISHVTTSDKTKLTSRSGQT